MPYEGLLQVFGVIAVFEWYSMTHKKGKWAGAVRGARGSAPPPSRSRARALTSGGPPHPKQDAWFTGLDSVVDQNFDPLGFGNADAAAVDRAKLQELEHGACGLESVAFRVHVNDPTALRADRPPRDARRDERRRRVRDPGLGAAPQVVREQSPGVMLARQSCARVLVCARGRRTWAGARTAASRWV